MAMSKAQISAALKVAVSKRHSSASCITAKCRVSPGKDRRHAGFRELNDDVFELHVAARPRDGQANDDVREHWAEVRLFHSVVIPMSNNDHC